MATNFGTACLVETSNATDICCAIQVCFGGGGSSLCIVVARSGRGAALQLWIVPGAAKNLCHGASRRRRHPRLCASGSVRTGIGPVSAVRRKTHVGQQGGRGARDPCRRRSGRREGIDSRGVAAQ